MKLIDYLATGVKQTDMAKAIGVCSVLVHQWAKGVRRVPAEHCPTIERATKGAVRCEDLRPDVDWAFLRKTCKRQAA